MLEPEPDNPPPHPLQKKANRSWSNNHWLDEQRTPVRNIFTDVIEKYTLGNGRLIMREVYPLNNDHFNIFWWKADRWLKHLYRKIFHHYYLSFCFCYYFWGEVFAIEYHLNDKIQWGFYNLQWIFHLYFVFNL